MFQISKHVTNFYLEKTQAYKRIKILYQTEQPIANSYDIL